MLAISNVVPLDVPIGASQDPQPIIGATLCLMSCVMQSGNAFYLPTIADNLAILANHPHVDGNFRRVCHRLCEHWESCLNNGRAVPGARSRVPGASEHTSNGPEVPCSPA